MHVREPVRWQARAAAGDGGDSPEEIERGGPGVSPRDPVMRIGEVAVCGTCLRTKLERTETASRRCRCGGRIVVMPRSEVEARRNDKG